MASSCEGGQWLGGLTASSINYKMLLILKCAGITLTHSSGAPILCKCYEDRNSLLHNKVVIQNKLFWSKIAQFFWKYKSQQTSEMSDCSCSGINFTKILWLAFILSIGSILLMRAVTSLLVNPQNHTSIVLGILFQRLSQTWILYMSYMMLHIHNVIGLVFTDERGNIGFYVTAYSWTSS